MTKCLECSTEVKYEGRTYCSRSCARKQPRSKRIAERQCAICSAAVPHNYKYCSEECRQAGLVAAGRFIVDDEYFVEGVKRNTGNTKIRLIKSGFKTAQCEKCDIIEWNGLPAPLQLDHMNGNKYDNRLENLMILCANCHAQTDTFCGKNHGRYVVG